jgi:DNA polymerase-1
MTLLLVDGNSVLNRAYYATTNLTNGATYGFLNMLFRELGESAATHLAVAFDVRAKTFRHEIYPEYKAGGRPMPDDLVLQFADTKKLLEIMNIQIHEKSGFEADDILGTLSAAAERAGHTTVIMTGDRDMLQLVADKTAVHLTTTNSTEIYNQARIMTEYGVSPAQLIDVKALMGDKSDNIPGAKNVGEKTALALIRDFGSLENVLQSKHEKIEPYREIVQTSHTLAKINRDIPLDFDFEKFAFSLPLEKHVYEAFKSRSFMSLCRRENLWDFPNSPKQLTMF